MRKGSAQPLLFKLTSFALVVTLLAVGVTTFFVARFAYGTLEQRVKSDLYSDAQIIKLTLEEAHAYGVLPLSDEFKDRITHLGSASQRLIRILDGQGAIVIDTIPAGLTNRELIMAEVTLNGEGRLQVAIEKDEISGMLKSLIRGTILIGLVVAVVAFGMAYSFNKVITNPIQELLAMVKHLQDREFGRLVLVRSKDEIGQLSRAFNELSETLEDLFFTISDREGKLQAILSSIDAGVVAVNLQRKVMLANKAAAELFRTDPEAMIGKNQFEATKNERLSRLLEETMDTKESVGEEIRLNPGSERMLSVTSSPLEDEQGNSLGAVAIMRDITSLRHLEHMRQEFVANVSHELRTPLTSIKGFAETLLNGNLDDRQLLERFLGIIGNETDRMIVLINDLLDLSHIESGRQPLHIEQVDMKKIFDDTILILHSQAKERNITLENNIYDPVIVQGDAKLLRQVALNLVENGVKYTPEGGKVWVEAVAGLDSVEFIISDNGLGIGSEHLDRIFERFYRVDKGRARHMGGTGLGLAITKHIVDKHKGSICAESRTGKGTKMRLTLRK